MAKVAGETKHLQPGGLPGLLDCRHELMFEPRKNHLEAKIAAGSAVGTPRGFLMFFLYFSVFRQVGLTTGELADESARRVATLVSTSGGGAAFWETFGPDSFYSKLARPLRAVGLSVHLCKEAQQGR